MPNAGEPVPGREANDSLVEALAKAYSWQEKIDAGEYAGVEELAKAQKVDRTYVGRILRLTALAPDIVEAIVRGQEPSGLSLRQLHNDLPVSWEEQRERQPI